MRNAGCLICLYPLTSPFSPTSIPTGVVAILHSLLLNSDLEQTAFRRCSELKITSNESPYLTTLSREATHITPSNPSISLPYSIS